MALRPVRPLALLATVLVAAQAGAAAPQATPATAFAVGRMLVLEGDFVGALDLFHQAAEASPKDPYVRLELAALHLRMGRAEEAERQAKEALALGAADADVLRAGAENLLALAEGRPEVVAAAQRELEKLLVLRPDDPEALQTLGRIYLSTGEPRRAEEMLRRLAAVVPDSRQVFNQLLHLLMQRGAKTDAAALLREQLERDPGSMELRLGLADLLSDTGDHAGAVALLRGAPAELAAQPEVERRLAFELYRVGDSTAAMALVDKLLAADPDPRLRLFRALLLEEANKDDEALRELERLHAELPTDPEVGLSLARILARGEKREEARALLEELLGTLEGGGPERRLIADRARLELAQLLGEEERWEEALGQLDKVGSTGGSTRAAATLLRVEALAGLGRKEEALAMLGPSSGLSAAALAAKRAEVLLSLGRDEEAGVELAKLPSGSEGKDRAAEVYQRSGHHAQAIPLLLELLQADPSSMDLRFRLGAAYERTGQVPEAVTVFRELLASAPDHSMALNYLGYMWAEKGENLPEALRLVQRAVELDPDNAAYIDSLGWVYFRMGDYGQAVEQLERAARLLPGDGTVQEHLGDALRAVGKIPEARTAYRRALALGDTDASQVRRKLEEVERDLQQQ